MAKNEAPKTVRLTYTAGNGDEVNVSVADDDEGVERLVAGGQFKKATARKSSSS